MGNQLLVATFSVLHLNVLDPGFSKPEDFEKSDPAQIGWEYRKDLIEKMVLEKNPDIITFAEARDPQDKDFDFKFRFNNGKKYEHIYKMKSSLPNGVSFYYSTEVFERMEEEKAFFKKPDGTDMSQVFIYVQLKHKKTGDIINCFTTHLKAKPIGVSERLIQAKAITEFCEDHGIKNNILITGDFNAEEDEKSMVDLQSNLFLSSVAEHRFTTFKLYKQNDFKPIKRKIDYIFYGKNDFELLYHWGVDKIVDKMPAGCPNQYCPSDHLPMYASFKINKNLVFV